jgi:hypothetical protein
MEGIQALRLIGDWQTSVEQAPPTHFFVALPALRGQTTWIPAPFDFAQGGTQEEDWRPSAFMLRLCSGRRLWLHSLGALRASVARRTEPRQEP